MSMAFLMPTSKHFTYLGRKLAQQSAHYRHGVANAADQQGFIKDAVEGLACTDLDFAKRFLYFAIELRTQDTERDSFADVGKYYDFMRNQKVHDPEPDLCKIGG